MAQQLPCSGVTALQTSINPAEKQFVSDPKLFTLYKAEIGLDK
jgi:hypothetical protein